MLGILVHGDNHFIVRGRRPDRAEALALTRQWSVIRIGAVAPPELAQWRISTKEFRENLEWAIDVPAGSEHSAAVQQLLNELRVRGIRVLDAGGDDW